jgi:hypothetical protein
MTKPTLLSLVDATIKRPVSEAIRAIGLAARDRHRPTCLAVLAYGSGLRGTPAADTLIDLYVLVSDYRTTYQSALEARANNILPPNVYYLEHRHNGEVVRAKYAIVTLEQFRQKCSGSTENPYFWARFAQPSALLWRYNKATAEAVAQTIARAVETLLTKTAPLVLDLADYEQTWLTALANTYRTEWRAEPADRAISLITANSAYYKSAHNAVFETRLKRDLGPIGGAPKDMSQCRRAWARRRAIGKILSLLRLSKAAFTFAGGPDYLVWKIERHSGVAIELTDWQRRHPILAGLWLLPKLYRAKVVR